MLAKGRSGSARSCVGEASVESAAFVAAVIGFAAEIEHVEQIIMAAARPLTATAGQDNGAPTRAPAGRIRYHLVP
jgi:hypothetical protein